MFFSAPATLPLVYHIVVLQLLATRINRLVILLTNIILLHAHPISLLIANQVLLAIFFCLMSQVSADTYFIEPQHLLKARQRESCHFDLLSAVYQGLRSGSSIRNLFPASRVCLLIF
jgi:hypothetical protein